MRPQTGNGVAALALAAGCAPAFPSPKSGQRSDQRQRPAAKRRKAQAPDGQATASPTTLPGKAAIGHCRARTAESKATPTRPPTIRRLAEAAIPAPAHGLAPKASGGGAPPKRRKVRPPQRTILAHRPRKLDAAGGAGRSCTSGIDQDPGR
jgi:hypothetical protein